MDSSPGDEKFRKVRGVLRVRRDLRGAGVCESQPGSPRVPVIGLFSLLRHHLGHL